MTRFIRFTSVAFLCAATGLSAQGSINQEPHHKRLLYTNDLRMFDVTIPPGQATGDHVHEYDMVTVIISGVTLQIQRNGQDVGAPASSAAGTVIVGEHTGAPATYRLSNTGTADYRVLELEDLREGGGWPASTALTAAGTSVIKDTRAFTIYDVRLKAGTPETMHAHPWPTVVILVEGAMENGGIGGEEPVRLQKPGQWLFLPRGLSHTVSAAGGGDTHVVEIEVR
jgi:quercetin dioxygenase-like cupin family protein